MRRYWFFDFDGTLCDTEADIKAAWRASIRALGRECPQFDEIYKTGPTLEQIAYRLFDDCTPALVERIKARFRDFYDNSGFPLTKPYPWTPGWIDGLKADGCDVFVVTNKRWNATDRLMKLLGWDRLFQSYYTFDMYTDEAVARRRPDLAGQKLTKGDLLKDILKERRIAPSEAVMVGDTVGDVTAGREAGVRTIGCTWGYGTREELAEADEIYDKDRF